MKRLMTKNWKLIAYIVGYAVLIVTELDTVNMLYVGAGMVWLVIWLLRNNDGSRAVEHDLSDSRGLFGAFSAYNHHR